MSDLVGNTLLVFPRGGSLMGLILCMCFVRLCFVRMCFVNDK